MTRQKPVEFRPDARRIVETIARIRGSPGRSYPHRNPASRIDEQKTAFIGQIVADKDRLAAGKRRVCKQRGDALSFVVVRLLEFGDHLALLHGKTAFLRECAKKFQDLTAEFRRLPEMNRERRTFVLKP